MAKYIDRDVALAFQNELEPILCRNVVTHDIMSATKDADLVKYLQSIPAADVRPVRRGKWTSVFDIGTVCNQCGYNIEEHGFDVRTDGEPNYCPNCGADMRAEEGE